jgi:hypothetical protein
MTRSQQIALLSVTLACAGAVALPARTALAQDQAAIDKMVQMNKKALDDFDTLDFDAAKRKLLDALAVGKKAGLDNHPVMGRTYIHLGALYITGFHDRQHGLQSFGRALEIDPTIQLSKGIDTPEVTSAFAEAQRNARAGGGGGGGEESAAGPKKKRRGPIMEGDESAADDRPRPRKRKNSDEEPDLPAHIAALDCPTPDEAIIDKPLVTRCAVAPNLPVASVYLMYRAPDKQDYNEVQMTKTPKGWLEARIPKKAVTGKSIQFYFEGRNASGKPVVANGGADSPNIVLVVEEEAAGEAARAGTGEEDENPLEENEGDQRPKLRLGRKDTSREGLDTRYGKRKWWIGIGVGTGYGFAKGNGFEAVNKSTETIPPNSPCSDTNPGFHCLQFQQGLAFAGLGHLVPEFGYAFTPNLAVSLEGRLQYTGIPAKYSQFAANYAVGVLAKLIFYTKQSQLRFFGTLIAGAGNYRFVGYPDAGSSNGYADFKDTVAAGPVLLGVGGGLYYETSKTVSLVVELHELAGLPLVGLVTDLNLSLQFNLYQAVSTGPKAYVPMGSDEEEPK